VFDKPVLFINVCNQLANCYLRLNRRREAKINFEESLLLIRKLKDTAEKVENSICA